MPTPDSPGTPFLFADRFPTADGRALLVPVEYLPPSEPAGEGIPSSSTGRQMYHWHTGTMTRRAEGLDSGPVPVVEICAVDAEALGVTEETVRVTSRRGSILIGVQFPNRPGAGLHPHALPRGSANLLTNPALDPYAKIAEFKVAAVRVEAVAAAMA